MVSSGYHIVLHPVRYGLLQWHSSKESAFYGVDAGDVASVPGLGRSMEEEMAMHSSNLEKSHGQRSLVDYSPWDRTE